MDSKKMCRICYEELDVREAKCPHCQQWQKPLRTLVSNPAFAGILVMLIICLIYAVVLSNLFLPPKSFASFSDQIVILDSAIQFGETKNGPSVAVIGKVKNNSTVNWEDIRFEVQYFDRTGNLIDTVTEDKYSMVIAAEKEQTFKISSLREFPEALYHSHKVVINYACEVHQLF